MVQGVEFEPTEEQRRSVETMAGYGVKQDDIAHVLKIDPKTMRRHFREELDRGTAVANVNIGRSLYELAVGRPAQYDARGKMLKEELKPDKSAAIFASKARLGMREVQRIEHTGKDGGPINMVDIDLSVFTDEELRLFMALYDKARRRRDEGDDGDRDLEAGGPAAGEWARPAK